MGKGKGVGKGEGKTEGKGKGRGRWKKESLRKVGRTDARSQYARTDARTLR